MTIMQRDTVSYSFVALVSGVLLLWAIPVFSPEYPGYGVPATLVPNIAAGCMLTFSLLGLFRLALARRKNRQKNVDGICWLHLVKFFVPCALLMPAMHALGVIPAGILFLLIVQWACGQRHPVSLVLISMGPVLIVYLLMRYALNVPMP